MDLPRIAVFVVIVAATTALGKETGTSGRHDEKEVFSPIISTNFKEKFSLNTFPELRVRVSKKTCGQPSPECTNECYDIRNYYGEMQCFCNKPNGPYNYHQLPCREYVKICKAGEHESFDYSKIHPQHSAAMPPKRGYTYLRQGVTDDEKQQILKIHNNYRAKVARGMEPRSPEQVSQPRGSNIKELIWNEELAYIAQKWASQCDFNHESPSSRRATCSRPYSYVGQNLFKATKSWAYKDNQWARAIGLWYEEVADTPISQVNDYAWGSTDKMIGHYTQMLWASTYEIGCGAVYYQGGYYKIGSATIYVCNYGPGGNTVGSEMYAIGRPASRCGKSGKSTKYRGLCAAKR